jgi:Fe-S-cluster-containing dehydrogenase component
MRYAMVIDTKKCVGCSDCVVACKTENDVPDGFCRDWIIESVRGRYPQVELEFRSERCNQCDNTPCVRTCPTGASFISDGGIILVDENLCIGCGACVESCPYDARFFHPDKGVVEKCTFCNHRVVEGDKPACVSVCPTNCMYFGDIDDSESEVAKLIEERKFKTLNPEVGTKPQVYYLI